MVYTRQEIFDKVCNHLLTQNAKAIEESDGGDYNMCLYIAPNGNKCAIGGIVPDEDLNPRCNAISLLSLIRGEWKHLFDEEDYGLLRSLQRIHDKMPVHHWKEQLAITGKVYNLTLPPILSSQGD